MALLFLSMFASGGIIIATMAWATDAFSVRNAGLIAGIGAGSWSAVVAIAMPIFGHLFDQRNYQLTYLLAALCPITGLLLWLLLTPGSHEPSKGPSQRTPAQ